MCEKLYGTLFNDNWEYTEAPAGTRFDDINALALSPIDIPHDMLINDCNDLYRSCTGIYRKRFTLSPSELGKCIVLRFDGVYQDCSVYINGSHVCSHKYGYSAFDADISRFAATENELVVIVRHDAPNSRWYSGAGIFRDVFLRIADTRHFAPDGIYIHTEPRGDGYSLTIDSECDNSDGLIITHTVIDENGKKVSECTVPYGETAEIILSSPKIWDITSPHIYILRCELKSPDGSTTYDTAENTFGCRDIRFDPDHGFFLNGRHLKLNGVCLHHDLGSLGAAYNSDIMRRRLLKMKDMGVNAIRTSHNMPACDMMRLADELGFLIDSEIYDVWSRPKTEFDSARWFDECCEEDVRSWVIRDRNHPSVIMWSIGNEIYDTHGGEYGMQETRRLVRAVRTHDPRRNALVTFGSNYIPWENTQKCADELDAVGCNYTEHIYRDLHEKHPKWCIYGSETAARGQSRGIYHFPLSHTCRTYEDLQLSSLENSRSGQGDRTPQQPIIWDRDCGFSAGQFIWTGIDYIGESTPYTTKCAYFGQVDTALFEKDTFYLYKSAWMPEKPTVHLLPYYDFNEGETIDVCAYTNCASVELFADGVSLGRQEIDIRHGDTLWGKWQMKYHKGVIKAVGYDENGNVSACDVQSSFGDGEKLVLSADRTEMPANGVSAAIVSISAMDGDGVFVANARNRVFVEVSSPGRLVGLDSGDSTDFETYKGSSKKLFSGRLSAIIMSTEQPGDIVVRVSSEGFPDESITIRATPCERIRGVSCITSNTPSPADSSVPVRKIALSCEGSHILDAENKTAGITAEIFPKNATLRGLKWRAVTDSGLDAPNASVTVIDENHAVVTAKGDGSFRLRCTADNGKPCTEVISDIVFTAQGLGSASFDPYSMIYAAMHTPHGEPLDEVLGGGVRCRRNYSTLIIFDNIDFGSDFSERVSVPIIRWFRDDAMPFEIWDNTPEDGELLWSGVFQKQFVWMTYLNEECTLSKRLTGMHRISVFIPHNDDTDVNVQGLKFEKIPRAYAVLSPSDAVNIYGDSFTRSGDDLCGIGNNVTLEFGRIDITDGITAVEICGRTHNEKDSVHILLYGDNTEKRFMVEVRRCEDISVFRLPIDGASLHGEYDLRLMFLPGCCFDLRSIRLIADET
ncbi:MAG: DUF4982 domain-containing protein [Oscillospiraceae bacterium]|nr:DUF4982 domain-containing protein [Oscillospiraceae bacterium]